MMSGATTTERVRPRVWASGLAAVLACTVLAPAAAAQAPDAAPPGEVETAPIQCWWKTGTTFIRIGERFTLTLTCGVIETSSITVVANTNGLDPGALALTPFEVVSGTRREDIVAPPWRYFQYDYRVRLLSEGFFGKDVAVPALRVTYNIQGLSGAGQGRDQTYVLPALPMRVASLVPQEASDIRDAVTIGFDAVEARRFRGASAAVAGGILLGGAGVLLIVGLIRAAAGVRQRRPAAARRVAPAAVLSACGRTLEAVRAEALRDGWSPALARRALTAARVAAAVGIGRAVAQAPAGPDSREREGQLAVRQGLVRRRRVLVSASTTQAAIDRELARGRVRPASRPAVDAIRDAIQAFTTAGYGRDAATATEGLDDALAGSLSAIKDLRRRAFFPPPGWPVLRAPEPGLSSPAVTQERS